LRAFIELTDAGQLTPDEAYFLAGNMLDQFLDLHNVVDIAARSMLNVALRHVILRDPACVEPLRHFDAYRKGFDGPDSDALMIVSIARSVEFQTSLRERRNADPTFERWAANSARALRNRVVDIFAASDLSDAANAVPSEEVLEAFLARHTTEKPRRGQKTTAGIVADIMIAAYQADGDEAERIRSRVSKVISRHATPSK